LVFQSGVILILTKRIAKENIVLLDGWRGKKELEKFAHKFTGKLNKSF
jgi:hypothetical protein